MSEQSRKIAILGTGAWGTALAIHLAKLGHHVRMWGRDEAQTALMQRSRINDRYLPRHTLPDGVMVSSDLSATLSDAQAMVCMMPSRAFGEFLALVAPYHQGQVIMWGCKGLLQHKDSMFFHHAVRQVLGASTPVVALSGPSFAQELANGMPTAVVLASDQVGVLDDVLPCFHGGSLRCYRSLDLEAVQLCGTYKNILAVAAGISDGLGLGANARSALITRGLAEIVRLAECLGSRVQPFMGLAGLGDMILSSTSDLSRNRRLGLQLGQGRTLSEAKAALGMHTIESISNVQALLALAAQYMVELPIAVAVQQVVEGHVQPADALTQLLSRGPKAEA